MEVIPSGRSGDIRSGSFKKFKTCRNLLFFDEQKNRPFPSKASIDLIQK